jgi:hypothetical protein
LTPASIIPVFGSQRPYADLNFAGGSFGLDGRTVSDLTALPGFTFTRASLAMGYDATGKLTYGPNNLATFSQAFDNAAWAKTGATVSADSTAAPDGTTTADTLIEDTSTGGHLLNRTITTGSAAPICYSVYIKAGPGSRKYRLEWFDGGSYIWRGTFDPSDNTFSTISTPGLAYGSVSVGNGWYRVYMVAQPAVTGTSQQLLQYLVSGSSTSYTGDGTSGIFIWGAQLEAVTYQTTPSTYYPTTTAAYYGPRLVYDPVTLASQGILVEEARTNLALQSNTFTSGTWPTATNVTVTAADAVSVDGTTNASKLADNTTAGVQHRIYRDYTFTSAAAHTLSLFVKRNDHRWMRLFFFDGTTSFWANFDMLNGVVGSKQASTTSRITNVGNSGWYRVEMTATVAAAAGNIQLVMLESDDTGVPSLYTGTGTSFWVYQAQLELGTGASSPIPTTTAAVTRAADNVNFTGLSAPAPYSVVSEFNVPRTASGVDIVNWGTLANGAGQYLATSGLAFVRESSSTTALVIGATVTANVTQKMAARYAVNDVNLAVNGTLATADTSVTPPTLTNIALSNSVYGFGGININGTISRIRIYNRALPDAQLQSLTT